MKDIHTQNHICRYRRRFFKSLRYKIFNLNKTEKRSNIIFYSLSERRLTYLSKLINTVFKKQKNAGCYCTSNLVR